ncbi:hypothetical protein [Pseudomonas tohonis]|uniref:hypothetical protein n=1 Tax=Pseudomonas tohonis TaxID=2725477 RepID=UPI001F19AE0A|nr:hypothetical protein [Pseudomonas tohonis]
MRCSPRLLLPALLLSSSVTAHAEQLVGDYWIVHHQGDLGVNELFVADGDAAHIVDRPGGIQSLGVYQVYEKTGKKLTSYDVEIDCGKNRVRINDAQDFGVFNDWTPVKVSSKWQSQPDAWLARSRDFLCQPGERASMRHLGKMSPLAMIDESREVFSAQGREQYKAAILKTIDDAFDRMAQQ